MASCRALVGRVEYSILRDVGTFGGTRLFEQRLKKRLKCGLNARGIAPEDVRVHESAAACIVVSVW